MSLGLGSRLFVVPVLAVTVLAVTVLAAIAVPARASDATSLQLEPSEVPAGQSDAPAAATSAAATSVSPPRPCQTDVYRQFDFWIGDWEVADSAGQPQGSNRIEVILGGCALSESWHGAGPSLGQSYSAYDGSSGKWRQSWVDNGGLVLNLTGELVDGAMVLEGAGRALDGTAVTHRVSWTPLEDGRVRQHWQTSADGVSWTDAFLGFYSRRPAD